MIKSKFLKIICPRCSKDKIIFGKSSMRTKCNKCNYLLVETTGGKSKVKARVTSVLWNYLPFHRRKQ